MRVKAIVKGNILILHDDIKLKKGEIDLDISNDDIIFEEKGKEKSFSESIWETIGKFPPSDIDWKKEWHRHLEEKYNG